LEVAEKLCNKVAIIKAGKLIRSGTMDQVKGDESLEEVFLELQNGALPELKKDANLDIEIPKFGK
jgi:ABC-2 type transport system ATP-binding protein